ncbi:hypothetical protein E2C01_007470 [Portunus trituberculatus]|uniref:Uncharacterized protein n=1 Tax=Portunus trituberculatus TaxID=210409 RepID=A0A5B7CZB8_PORTR|nr:hypothetical protein [Portunus trituberculatus]
MKTLENPKHPLFFMVRRCNTLVSGSAVTCLGGQLHGVSRARLIGNGDRVLIYLSTSVTSSI